MFGKVFASLWRGSMVGQADVQLVFVYMLANCNARGVLDQTPEVIAALTGVPIERVRGAIVVLEGPDPSSRSEAEEGRRILRLDAHRDWGWSIVNYLRYRATRDERDRREQTRRATAKWRSKVSRGEPAVSRGEPRRAQAEADADVEGRRIKGASPERPNGGASGASLFPDPGALASNEEGRSLTGGVRASGGEIVAARGGRDREAKGFEYLGVEPVPLAGGTDWRPTVWEHGEWERLFPDVDVAGEFRRMRAWALANPKKRKTKRGVRAFVRTWLDKEQNQGRGSGRQSGLAAGPGDRMKVREATEYREANTKS